MKKRKSNKETVEDVEVSIVGTKRLRKRQNVPHISLNEEADETVTGMNFPEFSSVIERVPDLLVESVPKPVVESVSEPVVELGFESAIELVLEPVGETVPELVVE